MSTIFRDLLAFNIILALLLAGCSSFGEIEESEEMIFEEDMVAQENDEEMIFSEDEAAHQEDEEMEFSENEVSAAPKQCAAIGDLVVDQFGPCL